MQWDSGVHRILGIQWNFTHDCFTFNIGDVLHHLEDLEPTKRSVVSMTTRFFAPLGVVSPVTIMFKMFFQQLCQEKVEWDEPLTGSLQQEWDQLCTSLK